MVSNLSESVLRIIIYIFKTKYVFSFTKPLCLEIGEQWKVFTLNYTVYTYSVYFFTM